MISELKIENNAAQDMLLFVCPMFLYPRIRSEYGKIGARPCGYISRS